MKKQFIIYITIFTLCFSFSCVDNEPELLFDDVPSERINDKVLEVKQLLLSSENGWKITYFTDNSVLGGFTYIFRFSEDGTVEMDSDFGETKGTVTSSLWTVDFGATVKLNFTTQNKIHELSDSNNAPNNALTGQGYRGSFEFLFYGIDGENLLFQASRDNNPIVFQKATEQDWNELSKNDEIILNIASKENRSVFRKLTVENKKYIFSYDEATRFASASSPEEILSFGVSFTPRGITIRPGIETSKGIISNFTYNANSGTFDASIEGRIIASIEYSDKPVFPLRGYLLLNNVLILHEPFLNSLSENESFSPDLTNENFKRFLVELNEDIPSFNITRIDLYNLNIDTGFLFVETTNGEAFFEFNKSITDDKVFLNLTETTDTDNISTSIQPLLDIIFDKNGLYVDQPTTLENFANLVFTFVPASNTTFQFSAVSL